MNFMLFKAALDYSSLYRSIHILDVMKQLRKKNLNRKIEFNLE